MNSTTSAAVLTLDEHLEESRRAQRRADKWLIAGTLLMGANVPGIFGFPLFLWGLALLRRALKSGLSVRPIMVTLIGYLVILDAGLNLQGWILDMLANHSLIYRVLYTAWGNAFDAGYFWHYNQLWIGGASAPGEKGWEGALILTVFPMDRCSHRIPANEALGLPVVAGDVLVRRRDLDWLRDEHDRVRRCALCRSRFPGPRLVDLRHHVHHSIPGDPVSAHRQPRDLHGLRRFQ